MKREQAGQGELRLWALVGRDSVRRDGPIERVSGCIPTFLNSRERLVQIMRDNQRLLHKLQRFRAGLDCARVYLGHPGCNTVLGIVSLNWAKTRYEGVLGELRANRIEVHQILGEPEFAVAPSIP